MKSLECELKRYGLNDIKDKNKDILTKENKRLINDLKNDNSITIRKADKSNVFVIMNRETYNNKLQSLLNDENKFKKIDEKPDKVIEKNKKKLNDIIQVVKEKSKRTIFNKVIGKKSPGFIYGTAKIHKNVENPPLRPVISTIPTPAYEVSKVINRIISKYSIRHKSLDSWIFKY